MGRMALLEVTAPQQNDLPYRLSPIDGCGMPQEGAYVSQLVTMQFLL